MTARPYTQSVAENPRKTNEKPIKLPDDFEQNLRDLIATGPTPKDTDEESEKD